MILIECIIKLIEKKIRKILNDILKKIIILLLLFLFNVTQIIDYILLLIFSIYKYLYVYINVDKIHSKWSCENLLFYLVNELIIFRFYYSKLNGNIFHFVLHFILGKVMQFGMLSLRSKPGTNGRP